MEILSDEICEWVNKMKRGMGESSPLISIKINILGWGNKREIMLILGSASCFPFFNTFKFDLITES